MFSSNVYTAVTTRKLFFVSYIILVGTEMSKLLTLLISTTASKVWSLITILLVFF